MRRLGLVPDLVLCSTARRARRTWDLAAAAMADTGAAPQVKVMRELYLATPQTMLALLAREGGDAARLMLVGHNPGLHELALQLAGTDAAGCRAQLTENLPTAALVRLGLEAPDWRGLAPGACRLLGFWRPREVE